MIRKRLLVVPFLLLLSGCAVKDQDMYAEQSYQDSQERSERKGEAFKSAVVPVVKPVAGAFAEVVGGVVVGTVEAVGQVGSAVASNPDLVLQGVKTYQQVNNDYRADQARSARLDAQLKASYQPQQTAKPVSYQTTSGSSTSSSSYTPAAASTGKKQETTIDKVCYGVFSGHQIKLINKTNASDSMDPFNSLSGYEIGKISGGGEIVGYYVCDNDDGYRITTTAWKIVKMKHAGMPSDYRCGDHANAERNSIEQAVQAVRSCNGNIVRHNLDAKYYR